MKRRKAYLLSLSYTVKNGKTYVVLLVKGKKVTKLYYQYDPYFLVDAPEDKREAIEMMELFVKGESVSPIKAETTTVLSKLKKKKFIKVICKKPADVPILKGAIPFPCYEFSIPFIRRFIFDFQLVPNGVIKYERKGRLIKKILGCEQGKIDLKTLAFDIETYNPLGMPREKKDPVIMISYDGKKKGVISTKKSKEKYVETVEDEKALIERFTEIVQEEDPDVMFGYNSANFDIPYLQTRAEVVNADFTITRKGSKIRKVKKGMINGVDVGGRTHIDLYPIVRFFGFIGVIKAQNFTLDAVASEVLGRGKVEIKKGEMWKLWDEGKIDELAFYSFTDSEITSELGKRVLPIEVELSTVTKMPLFDTSLSTSGQLVENLLMYNAAEKNMLIPPKPIGESIGERLNNPIQGAFVKLPEPGVYDNIAVMDFRGLYPSIIVSYNIDPDTLTEKENKTTVKSPTGAIFDTKTKGLVPSVLDYLIDFRVKMKRKLKTLDPDSDEYVRIAARSQAVKILSNSITGDEPLLLLGPDKRIQIINASDFIDCRLKDQYIKNTQLGDANGWQAACFVGDNISFRPIKKLMRHGAREILKLRLKSGREIKVTNDHAVFTLDKDYEITPVAACDLKEKSPVVVPRKMVSLKRGRPANKINLVKALANIPEEETEDLVLTIRLGQNTKWFDTAQRILNKLNDDGDSYPTAIGNGIGVGYKSIGNQLKRLADMKLVERLGENSYPSYVYRVNGRGIKYAEFLTKIIPYLKYDGNSRLHYLNFKDIRSHISNFSDDFLEDFFIGPLKGAKTGAEVNITPKLARLLGYYVSEGYSRKWLNKTGGYSYRSELVNYNKKILDDMEDCFSELGLKIEKSNRSVQSNTKMSYLLFKYVFNAGESAYKKRVPILILNGSEEIQSNFIHTYFLGDGTYSRKQKRYKFTTVSRELANGLVFLLLGLGISDVTLSKDSNYYRVFVWSEIPFIGLNAQKKINRHFSRSVPGKYLENEIRKVKKINYYFAINKRISKKQLERFYSEYCEKFGKSHKVEKLLSYFDSDLAFDYVVKIEKLNMEQPVYDLSVKDAENFIGGFGWTCLHNSFYGYLGYARSRWYSRKCAESVTAWGRKHIQDTIEAAESKGFKVLYADTDSVFLIYEDKKQVLDFVDEVNKSLPEKMELEFEGFYPRGVFVSKKTGEERGAKKKYAMIGEDGRIKIRGFELVRRDWSSIAKNTQRNVLEAILKDGSKEKAVSIVRDSIERLKSGKVPLEELAIITQLNKDPRGGYDVKSPELFAAKKLMAAGKPVERGSVISYVITKKGSSISEKAVPLEMAKDYDADYYINNQVLPAVMKILKELGYDEYGLKVGGKQKGLDSFF